ncbi:hypothetical protein [Paraflavitalea speifideaquila]|uniref:hypothetical protein n=1 Tax=Paraflavitalea speifideaquila TaxID=3076558 RepID=UPI0028E7DF2C|nr:hypothetical protein [Paraflavitalea speifideiaquila]
MAQHVPGFSRYDLLTGVLTGYNPQPRLNHQYFEDGKGRLWLRGDVFDLYDPIKDSFWIIPLYRTRKKEGMK